MEMLRVRPTPTHIYLIKANMLSSWVQIRQSWCRHETLALVPEAPIQNTNKTPPLILIVWYSLAETLPHTQSEPPVSNFALIKIKIKKTLFFNYFCLNVSINVIPQFCSADDFEQKVETLTTVNHNYTQHTDPQQCVPANVVSCN